ncbi:hypothetical protein AB0J43_05420 [Nonomuraea fuscirosea]
MSDLSPTEFITWWLLNDKAPAYLREDAMWRAQRAIDDAYTGDRQHYLGELETLVGYERNTAREHCDYASHLRDALTDEQIEAADWAKVAEALVAAGKAAEEGIAR